MKILKVLFSLKFYFTIRLFSVYYYFTSIKYYVSL